MTNPVWLWMFRHGVEGTDWGRRPVDQMQVAAALQELAGLVEDEGTRAEVKRINAGLMLVQVQAMVREAEESIT